jgi:hypothetical protein
MSSYVSERWLVAPILEAKRLKEDTQFKTLWIYYTERKLGNLLHLNIIQ